MINTNLLINNKNWNLLFKSWENGKLPHAILLHGPTGSGKEGHAIELAALLNCNFIQNKQPCGNCSSCNKIKSFQHENMKYILPLPRGKIKSKNDSETKAFTDIILKEYLQMIKKKEKNPYYPIQIKGANTILINSIRDLKHFLALSTPNNAWKIIIISEADKLCIPNPEAAHALLKVLEEPPNNTLFILVSSNADIIIDTIHSRCQKIFFPPISSSVIQKNIQELGSDSNRALIISRISRGNFQLAKELHDDSENMMEILFLLINSCFTKKPNKWSLCIDEINRLKSKNIQQLKIIFLCTTLFFRDLLYYSTTNSENNIIFKKQLIQIKKITDIYANANWHECIEHIENTQNYIFRNGYLPLQIFCMFLDIQKALKGVVLKQFNLDDWISI